MFDVCLDRSVRVLVGSCAGRVVAVVTGSTGPGPGTNLTLTIRLLTHNTTIGPGARVGEAPDN